MDNETFICEQCDEEFTGARNRSKKRRFCSQSCLHASMIKHPLPPIFDFIVQYKMKNDGCSPVIREIMEATGITSTSVMANKLSQLETAGLIKCQQGAAKIVVIGGQWVPPTPAQ
ncbi:MAG: hypothetical protein AAF485_27520 [Chloroflexota bacterium]